MADFQIPDIGGWLVGLEQRWPGDICSQIEHVENVLMSPLSDEKAWRVAAEVRCILWARVREMLKSVGAAGMDSRLKETEARLADCTKAMEEMRATVEQLREAAAAGRQQIAMLTATVNGILQGVPPRTAADDECVITLGRNGVKLSFTTHDRCKALLELMGLEGNFNQEAMQRLMQLVGNVSYYSVDKQFNVNNRRRGYSSEQVAQFVAQNKNKLFPPGKK